MCLSIAVRHPKQVLKQSSHLGIEWVITHNGMGVRCGYIKVLPGHPWYGKTTDNEKLYDINVHGGITFAQADVSCDGKGEDNGWWLGFDCGHSGDRPDLDLPMDEAGKLIAKTLATASIDNGKIRTTEYVEQQCMNLCEQAKELESKST